MRLSNKTTLLLGSHTIIATASFSHDCFPFTTTVFLFNPVLFYPVLPTSVFSLFFLSLSLLFSVFYTIIGVWSSELLLPSLAFKSC
jgi:hypothetical protein